MAFIGNVELRFSIQQHFCRWEFLWLFIRVLFHKFFFSFISLVGFVLFIFLHMSSTGGRRFRAIACLFEYIKLHRQMWLPFRPTLTDFVFIELIFESITVHTPSARYFFSSPGASSDFSFSFKCTVTHTLTRDTHHRAVHCECTA